jgi:hypothetical protein
MLQRSSMVYCGKRANSESWCDGDIGPPRTTQLGNREGDGEGDDTDTGIENQSTYRLHCSGRYLSWKAVNQSQG